MENTLLNMIPSSYIPEVHLSQYDVGRSIPFKLMDGNSEYSVPSGANIKILATKPSGLGFEVACTFSGNIVTLVNTETMSNESGRFRAELRITSGNVILGTSNFIMNVERSPHPEGTIDGDAETLLPELTLLVERIEDSNARIESMTASATPLPSGQNPTATYNPTTNSLDLGIPVADRQYITVDGVNYAITSITKTVVDEVSGLLVAYGTDSTVFIPDGVGVKNVAQILQAQINGKVSAVKLNGDILTPHYDSAFGDGVVDLGTISDDTKADAIVKSASGSIASFSDGGDNLPMKSLKVNIVPKQSGTGDPSPSNVRAISGWDAVAVNVSGADTSDYETITTNLPQTVYGGNLDVVSGKLTLNHAMVDMGTLPWEYYVESSTKAYFYAGLSDPKGYNGWEVPSAWCEKYKTQTWNDMSQGEFSIFWARSNGINVIDNAYTSASTFKTSVNGVKLVYELATPTEIQLTPQEVKTLLGSNNVWSESGTVEVEYRADTTLAYNELLAMILENMGN